ncbi:MAG: flagellar export protein FliJ [Lachnospiraceae bacterium]|nr:flagellar export protein FliJ [Lachnospiraceae bacterium]
MAKFLYRMQNILDIKYKLEEAAKQEYAEAVRLLAIEEEKLELLEHRRYGYYLDYNDSIKGRLDFVKIDECGNAMDIMDEMIVAQNEVIREKSKEVEKARNKLNTVMQERKMHEKLKENKFEEFKQEINEAEAKETDQVVSYQFNNKNAEG